MSQSAVKTPLARRRDEIANFVNGIRDEGALGIQAGIAGDELFKSMVDLAINEYGVNPDVLATSAKLSSQEVHAWLDGRQLPEHSVRIEVMKCIASLLEVTDGDE